MTNRLFFPTEAVGIVNEPTKDKGYGNPPREGIVVNRDENGNVVSVGVTCSLDEKLFDVKNLEVYEITDEDKNEPTKTK